MKKIFLLLICVSVLGCSKKSDNATPSPLPLSKIIFISYNQRVDSLGVVISKGYANSVVNANTGYDSIFFNEDSTMTEKTLYLSPLYARIYTFPISISNRYPFIVKIGNYNDTANTWIYNLFGKYGYVQMTQDGGNLTISDSLYKSYNNFLITH